MTTAETGVTHVYTQFGITPTPTFNSNAAFLPVSSFTGTTAETEQYFFHPDHLGSSNYITNFVGDVSQHMEYFAFGETFVEEHKNSHNSPYKFNGKELDEESGYTYFGARYLDMRYSIWTAVDPLAEKYPGWSPYNYALQNPVKFIDPDGMDPTPFYKFLLGHTGYYAWRYRDFVRQNPGVKPPDYYMGYGNKYISRFTNETSKTMSSAGKIWLKEARYNLQVAIEDRLDKRKNPKDYNTIELDNDKFRSFAFDSHVNAYWNEKGKVPLYTLGAVDLTKILLTPDAKDLTSPDGLRQVKDMMGKFIFEKPKELGRILEDAYENRDIIQGLIENKAKKEGVPVDVIKKALGPYLILIPNQQQKKTK